MVKQILIFFFCFTLWCVFGASKFIGANKVYSFEEIQKREAVLNNKVRDDAQLGDPQAQIDLGSAYYHGIFVKQSYSEALKWYRLAALQGSAEGQYKLGNMYYYAKAVKKDYSEALKWYRIAASHGDAPSQEMLRLMSGNGAGFSRDTKYDVATLIHKQPVILVRDYGAKGDGVTDDWAAINRALSATPAGATLSFDAGKTYLINCYQHRYPKSKNITKSVTIDGHGCRFITDMTVAGNEHYAVFQSADKVTGVTIKNMIVSGGALYWGYQTNNSLIENVIVDGKVGTAEGINKLVFIQGGKNNTIKNSRFSNGVFNVYIGNTDPAKPSQNTLIENCHIENTIIHQKDNYPVGVYVLQAEDTWIINNKIINILLSPGGIGIGYGIYQGDATSGNLYIRGNTIRNNITSEANDGRVYNILLSDLKGDCVIEDNNCFIKTPPSPPASSSLNAAIKGTRNNYSVFIRGNNFINEGHYQGMGCYALPNQTKKGKIVITDNFFKNQYIVLSNSLVNSDPAVAPSALNDVLVSNNIFDGVQYHWASALMISSTLTAMTQLNSLIATGNQITGWPGFIGYSVNRGVVNTATIQGNSFYGIDERHSFVTLSVNDKGTCSENKAYYEYDKNLLKITPIASGSFTKGQFIHIPLPTNIN